MSPFPSRASAPFWSRIVLESVFDATRKAIRVGKFALISPVMTFTDGTLRRDDEVDSDRTGLLGELRERLLDLGLHRHHEIRQLVDDDDDVRHDPVGVDPPVLVSLGPLGLRAPEHLVLPDLLVELAGSSGRSSAFNSA